MTADRLDDLRAEVARHVGPARARPLTDLGRALANEYWRTGPGQPAASAYLDEAVSVLGEAHGHLEPGEAPRARTASMTGWLLGTRHLAHGGDVADRDRGIRLLDESLEGAFLEPVQAVLSRLVLGQLLMARPLHGLSQGGLDPRALLSGLPAADGADLVRAIGCFRRVADDPRAPVEAAEAARTMLKVAEMLQSLTGGMGGLDLGRMMSALTTLQDMQRRAATRPSGSGFGYRPNPFEFVADEIAGREPEHRPVASVIEPEPARPTAEPPRTPKPAAAPVPAVELRRAFRAALPGGSVRALLDPGGPVLDADTVDRLVARSEALVTAEDGEAGDRVLHAVALYHRGLLGGDGWGDGGDPADLRAAADELLSARLTGATAGTVVDAVRLADRLAERSPALAVRNRLGEQFRAVADALRAAGVGGLLYPAPDGSLLYPVNGSGFTDVDGGQLPERVVVVGDYTLAAESVFSVVRTATQAAELAGRRRRAPGAAAVFVGNPRKDREHASIETMLLRRTFYPHSVGLGQTVENADGAGTPAEVRASLDASMLHLACGVTEEGGLELAGPEVLTAEEIATADGDGGLAVLPPTPSGTEPLVDALLAAGFSGAVHLRTAVPDEVASLVYVLLHTELVDEGRDPVNAVARVRRWLRDPDRVLPDHLPSWYRATAAGSDVADPAVAAAVVHHGV